MKYLRLLTFYLSLLLFFPNYINAQNNYKDSLEKYESLLNSEDNEFIFSSVNILNTTKNKAISGPGGLGPTEGRSA